MASRSVFSDLFGSATESLRVSWDSQEALKAELLELLEARTGACVSVDVRRELLARCFAGTGPGRGPCPCPCPSPCPVLLEDLIHACISPSESLFTAPEVSGVLTCVRLEPLPELNTEFSSLLPRSRARCPHLSLQQGSDVIWQDPAREDRRTAGLVALCALLLADPSATQSLLGDSNTAALVSCLEYEKSTSGLAAAALSYGCSPRVCGAILERIRALPRSDDVKPTLLSSLCFVASSAVASPKMKGTNLARRLEAGLFTLFREHSCDAACVSDFASAMLEPRAGVAPATACLDLLAQLLDARTGLVVGARFCRRSQVHQCAVLHELFARVLAQLGALPRECPPVRVLSPPHSALLCDVVARCVKLAAEKCTGPGCEAKMARLHAKAAAAVLCAARSCSAYL